MPDPIRVNKAVRRCDGCHGSGYIDIVDETGPDAYPCPDCTDGWVDVPVDEECDWCSGDGWGWSGTERGHITCPDCGGGGRRLHDWATGLEHGDLVLVRYDGEDVLGRIVGRNDDRFEVRDLDGYSLGSFPASAITLVLSDPSHRPEPMRWKQ